MRTFSRLAFAAVTAAAVLWITAPDVVAWLVRPLPQNTLQFEYTRELQHFHFSHYATGTAWLVWLALIVIGWRMKKWGRAQIGVGVPLGLLGAMPVAAFARLGVSSAISIARRWDWIDAALILVTVLVFAAKAFIWRCWWQLAVSETRQAAQANRRIKT